jgi:hypothetical protein
MSLVVGWQQIADPTACPASPQNCDSHPTAETWGVIGAAVLAALMVTALVRAARSGDTRPDGRWWVVRTAVVAAILVALAVAVTVTTRSWASQQAQPSFGGLAATVSVVAAAAAGLLAVWTLVAWPGSRRVALGLGVAVAVVATGITTTASAVSWHRLSLDATTAAAVPAPSGQVAAAPSHLLWGTQGIFQSGDEFTVAGGLFIEAAYADGRQGVEAVDLATGRVRWRYLHADGGLGPTLVMSAQAVGLFYAGLPSVYLDAATGKAEPLTQPKLAVLGRVDQAMLGTTYVKAEAVGRSGEVAATSAVTGQRLWADRVADCPVFSIASPANVADSEPTVVQAGPTIAVLYGCQRDANAEVITHLGLFGPGGRQRDVTIGDAGDVVGGGSFTVGLFTAGNTVLVKTPVSPENPANEETAVDAATGAVLWRMPYVNLDAILGGGQVFLTSSPSSCGRYATASGRACRALNVEIPEVAAGGRVYVPEIVGMNGEPVLGIGAKVRSGLKVVTVDASDGAILPAPVIQLPAWAESSGFDPTVSRADGNTLIVSGLDGTAGFMAFAVR